MNQHILSIQPNQRLKDEKLEERTAKRSAQLQELAIKNSKHFAKSNQPRISDEKLDPYVGDIKGGYEKLAHETNQHMQSHSHITDTKMEADYLKQRNEELEADIAQLKAENINDSTQVEKFIPDAIPKRYLKLALVSLFLFGGEIIFTSLSFQSIGENLLFSLGLSFAVSLAILLLAHGTGVIYRRCKKRLHKILVLIASFIIVLTAFIALSTMRSSYMAYMGQDINPIFFIIFNIIFYIVALYLSFFYYPTKEETDEHRRCSGICKNISRREKEIELKLAEIEKNKKDFLEKSKLRAQLIQYNEYLKQTIIKMYFEAIELFKSNNLMYRTDRKTPPCFNNRVIAPDVHLDNSIQLNTTFNKKIA